MSGTRGIVTQSGLSTREGSLLSKSDTVLSRASAAPPKNSLSTTQSQIDLLTSQFITEASDWRNLTAMMAGGLAYRWGKMGIFNLAQGHVTAVPLRMGAIAFGLASEVTAFEFTNRTFQTVGANLATEGSPGGIFAPNEGRSQGSPLPPNLWSWTGPGGWKEGLLSSLVTFSFLKGAGHLAREENLILQQIFPAGAMVTGHQVTGLLGITPKPEGSLADQFTHAIVTNLQMGAGMSLAHSLTGGRISALERGMDVSLKSMATSWPRAGGESPSLQGWAFAGNASLHTEKINSSKESPFILNSIGDPTRGGGGKTGPIERSAAEKKALQQALSIEGALRNQDPAERAVKVHSLRTILPELHELDQAPRLEKLAEMLNDSDSWVRGETMFSLGELSPLALRTHGRAWLADQLERGFQDSNSDVVAYSLEYYKDLLPSFDPSERLGVALKMVEALKNPNPEARIHALDILPDVSPLFEEADRVFFLPRIAEAWNEMRSLPEGEKDSLMALLKISQSLRFPERMKFLEDLLKTEGLLRLPLVIVSLLIPRGSTAAFLHYAEKSGNANLVKLAAYHAAEMPYDPYFWKNYLAAKDPAVYLAETSSHIIPHRQGKVLTTFEERELHQAFAGLDSPAGLSYEVFAKQMNRKSPPPLFLDRHFAAGIKEIKTFHELIDKGKLNQALKPLESVKTLKSLQEDLMARLERDRGSLKDFQKEIEEFLGHEGTEGLSEAHNKIYYFLPRLAEKMGSPAVQDLILHLGFFLAWHRADAEPLKQKMLMSQGKVVPSETLWEGLKATEEFYRNSVEEIFLSLKLEGESLAPLRKMRRLLMAELERVKGSRGQEILVEFFPSKSQSDQFFGYVGEDCNKNKGHLVYRKDFQFYRMVSQGRLMGIVYLQNAKLDGKKVLVMALQPRSSWTVEHAGLLKALETNLGQIASEEGYNEVLLINARLQQSNRQDMLKAIEERGYPAITHKKKISGALFWGGEFLLMWKKETPPKKTAREILKGLKEKLRKGK